MGKPFFVPRDGTKGDPTKDISPSLLNKGLKDLINGDKKGLDAGVEWAKQCWDNIHINGAQSELDTLLEMWEQLVHEMVKRSKMHLEMVEEYKGIGQVVENLNKAKEEYEARFGAVPQTIATIHSRIEVLTTLSIEELRERLLIPTPPTETKKKRRSGRSW